MKRKKGGSIEKVEVYQVGRSLGVYNRGITGGADASASGSEERRGGRSWGQRIFVGLLLVALVAAGFWIWKPVVEDSGSEQGDSGGAMVAEVLIVDEAHYGVSERVRVAARRLANELGDYGVKLDRVVLPVGLVRQLDVYIEGREEYYKVLVDRSPAESAEDVVRVMHYLERVGKQVKYVDVRVAGRAYYL